MAMLREELREHVRVSHQMVAQFRVGDEVRDAISVDVSSGGAFFRTTVPPRPGARQPITVWPVPGSDASVEMLFEVLWTMDGGSRTNGGFGGRWLAAASPDATAMRALLKGILQVDGGIVQVVPDPREPAKRRYLYRFARGEAQEGRGAPPEPPPPDTDARRGGTDQAVFLSATVRNERGSVAAAVIGVGRDALRVRVAEGLPRSFQRSEVHLLIDSSDGLLPIVFRGQVSFTRPQPDSPGAGDFVLKITGVEEYGRKGLFQQFLSYLDKAA